MDNYRLMSRYIPVNDDWEYRFSDKTILVRMFTKERYIRIEVCSTQDVEVYIEAHYLSGSALELDWNFYFENLFLSIPDYVNREWFLEHDFNDKNFEKI